jgi:hypothetical protein
VPQAHFSAVAALSTTLSPSCELRHAPVAWEKARLLESMTFCALAPIAAPKLFDPAMAMEKGDVHEQYV